MSALRPHYPSWPVKTRELHNHHLDSTVWNELAFRDDDIVVASYQKSGTTWVQQIIAQLLFAGAAEVHVAAMSPWLDLRWPGKEEKLAAVAAQTHRRFLKTHLPVDALVYSPRAKYLYIGRDGRDVLWSLHNHHVNANELWYEALNDTPGRAGPPIGRPPADIRRYFRDWLEGDGYPFWPLWENVGSWWAIRDLPNLMLLHFSQLKADLPREIRRIAAFLEIPINERRWSAILEHCGFEHMKAHAAGVAPGGGMFWDGGARTFVHKGTNGRWRDVLGEADCARYEETARRELGDVCARWLASGEAPPTRAPTPLSPMY